MLQATSERHLQKALLCWETLRCVGDIVADCEVIVLPYLLEKKRKKKTLRQLARSKSFRARAVTNLRFL